MDTYAYIERTSKQFSEKIGLEPEVSRFLLAHGDKFYQYRHVLAEKGIPFAKGLMVYLLTYCHPYTKHVRDTKEGWVSPIDWVVDVCLGNYPEFANVKQALDELPEH